jgi:hypothetical protein
VDDGWRRRVRLCELYVRAWLPMREAVMGMLSVVMFAIGTIVSVVAVILAAVSAISSVYDLIYDRGHAAGFTAGQLSVQEQAVFQGYGHRSGGFFWKSAQEIAADYVIHSQPASRDK